MGNVVQHPRSPQNLSPSTLAEIRAEARSILVAQKIEFGAAIDLATEMYDRSALPAPPDVKAYIRGLAEAMAGFQAPIAKQCCDPIKGVTRRLRWRPEINDVLEFCEGRVEFYDRLIADRRNSVGLQPVPHSPEECARVQHKCAELLVQMSRPKREEEQIAEAHDKLRGALTEASAGFKIAASEHLSRIIRGADSFDPKAPEPLSD